MLDLSSAWCLFRGRCLAPGLNRCIIAATLSLLPILKHRRVPPQSQSEVRTRVQDYGCVKREALETLAVPQRPRAQRVSDLGADPATGQLAARACLPGLTWRPGRGEGRGRREGAA